MTKTNVETVTEFMEYGSPMRQLFVIEAITRYADQVAAACPEQLENWKGFLSGSAWQHTAREAQEAFAHYSNPTAQEDAP